MVRRLSVLALVALGIAGVSVYVRHANRPGPPRVSALSMAQGDVVEVAVATGTLTPARTVEIGTQVSGMVQRLYVDYNSIVKTNQVLAKLDPSLIQTALDAANATLARADVDLKLDEDVLETDRLAAKREEDLYAGHLATQVERETSELQVSADESKIHDDTAARAIAATGVQVAQVNLDYCTITSPVDGVVISRNVDEGQTVAANMAVPTLFVLATDLTQLDLIGTVDESEVAKVRVGQDVAFTVDAYPSTIFHGTVTEVRLNATTVNNVVTYDTVIAVSNGDLRLRPSMTANLKIEISRATGVLRVPNVALRFKPTATILAAFQPLAPGSAGPHADSGAAPAVRNRQTEPQPGIVIGASTPTMLPPPVQSGAEVWVVQDQQLEQVPLRLGITDGTWTEVVDGAVHSGEEVVTGVVVPGLKRAP